MQLEADLTCPNCKKKFKQKLSDMRPGNQRRCPHCHQSIRFAGDDASKIQKSLDNLERTIKNLNKKLTIKF
jgi:Zn finger protein HypA/HybF involved in hydrogenase expression